MLSRRQREQLHMKGASILVRAVNCTAPQWQLPLWSGASVSGVVMGGNPRSFYVNKERTNAVASQPHAAARPGPAQTDCKLPVSGARTNLIASGENVGDGIRFMAVQKPKLATIFGGSGFIGTQLTQELARRGYAVRVAVRRPDLAGHVRMFGFPGQIQPVQANLRFPDSVAAAMRGSDLVINLVGIQFEKGGQRFGAIHVQGARAVAEAARAAGIGTLIHMSALGVDPHSPSAYIRAKALGEAAVAKAFPQAIIIRPSLVFG